jgi:hypothetical protein
LKSKNLAGATHIPYSKKSRRIARTFLPLYRFQIPNFILNSNHAGLQLDREQTIWAAANTLRAWIEKQGVPQALHLDRKNVRKHAPPQRQHLQGEDPVTIPAHVRKIGRRNHRAGIAAGQWSGRAPSRHASRPSDRKVEAEPHHSARHDRQIKVKVSVCGEGLCVWRRSLGVAKVSRCGEGL